MHKKISSLHLHGMFKGNWFWLPLFQFLLLTASESVACYTNDKKSIKTAKNRQTPWYIPLKNFFHGFLVFCLIVVGELWFLVWLLHLPSTSSSSGVFDRFQKTNISNNNTGIILFFFIFLAIWYALISANALFDRITSLCSFS